MQPIVQKVVIHSANTFEYLADARCCARTPGIQGEKDVSAPAVVELTIQWGRQTTNKINNKTTVFVRSECRRNTQGEDRHGKGPCGES